MTILNDKQCLSLRCPAAQHVYGQIPLESQLRAQGGASIHVATRPGWVPVNMSLAVEAVSSSSRTL